MHEYASETLVKNILIILEVKAATHMSSTHVVTVGSYGTHHIA